MTLFYVAAHALINRDGHYLIVKRSASNDYMPSVWDLPGGTVEVGETVEEALLREVYEETRLKVAIADILYLYTNRGSLPQQQSFQSVYACDYLDGDVQLNAIEHEAFAWRTKVQMKGLDAMAYLTAFTESKKFHDI